MTALTSLDRDHWAEQWCRVGLAYEAEGDARAKAGAGGDELAELFLQGFDTCRVGRYPAPTSPGQLAAYHHSLRIFRKAAPISSRGSRSSSCRSRARRWSAISSFRPA